MIAWHDMRKIWKYTIKVWYDLETKELMIDSATVNETMRSLQTKEQLLIEAAQYPKTFSDVEIFNLLVD